MDLLKNKKDNSSAEERNSIKSNEGPNCFRTTVKIDNNAKARIQKIKEDLIQGNIKQEDLNNEDLEEVTILLKEEFIQNEIKIRGLQAQIAKHKKNN